MQHVLQNYSYHLPLLISTREFSQLPSSPEPFRFQVAWTTHERFKKALQDHWPTGATIVPALKSLTNALTVWNKEVFGNRFQRKRKLWARIQGVQRKLNEDHNPYLRKLKMRLKGQLRIVLDQIETFWMQKSRFEAIRDRDRNTRYFHTSTIIHRKFNHIEILQNDGDQWFIDSNEVRSMVRNFFQGLYTEEQT